MSRLSPNDRREKILETATLLFLKHGYSGTSLKMIVEIAGGSRRSIYDLFGDKEALFEKAMLRVFSGAPIAFNQIDLNQKPEVVLNQIGNLLLTELVERNRNLNLITLAADLQLFPKLAKLIFEDGPDMMRDTLAEYFAQLNKQAVLEISNCKGTAGLFLSMVSGEFQRTMLKTTRYSMTKTEIESHVTFATNTFLLGILSRNS